MEEGLTGMEIITYLMLTIKTYFECIFKTKQVSKQQNSAIIALMKGFSWLVSNESLQLQTLTLS